MTGDAPRGSDPDATRTFVAKRVQQQSSTNPATDSAREDALNAPAGLPSDGLALDIPCIRCDYNLRSLAISARCPECGTVVQDSLDPGRLALAAPAWLRKLRWGTLILAACIILELTVSVFEVLIRRLLTGSAQKPFVDALASSTIWIRSVGALVVAIATLLATARPFPAAVGRRHSLLRVSARAVCVAAAIAALLQPGSIAWLYEVRWVPAVSQGEFQYVILGVSSSRWLANLLINIPASALAIGFALLLFYYARLIASPLRMSLANWSRRGAFVVLAVGMARVICEIVTAGWVTWVSLLIEFGVIPQTAHRWWFGFSTFTDTIRVFSFAALVCIVAPLLYLNSRVLARMPGQPAR